MTHNRADKEQKQSSVALAIIGFIIVAGALSTPPHVSWPLAEASARSANRRPNHLQSCRITSSIPEPGCARFLGRFSERV
jgi:hypothetical protein